MVAFMSQLYSAENVVVGFLLVIVFNSAVHALKLNSAAPSALAV